MLVSYRPLEDGPRRIVWPRYGAAAVRWHTQQPHVCRSCCSTANCCAKTSKNSPTGPVPPHTHFAAAVLFLLRSTAPQQTMQAPNRPTRRRRRIVESDDSEEEVTYEVAPTVAPPAQKKSRAQKPRPPQRPAKRPCAEARPVLRENARLTQPSQKQPRRRGAAPTPRPPTPEWDVEPEDEDEHAAGARGRGGRGTRGRGGRGIRGRARPRPGRRRAAARAARRGRRLGAAARAARRAPPAPPPVPCQLTADQRAVAAWRPPAWAADRRGKLVRVVAHAGTGKTTTLAALAANLAASARPGRRASSPGSS